MKGTINTSNETQNLLHKPIAMMTGEELISLLNDFINEETCNKPLNDDVKPRYVYGMAGLAQIFGCSVPTANRIKASGIIKDAITQVKRKIVIDVDKAIALAKEAELKNIHFQDL